MKAWIVFDPDTVSALLRDSSILACSLVDALARLTDRYDVPLPSLLAVAERISLGLDGAAHQTVRRQMAQLLLTGQERVGRCLTDLVERHFAPLARSGEVEVVAECVVPFVEELFSEILCSKERIPFRPRTVGRIFDRFTGVGTLVKIDVELAVLRERLVATDIDDPDLALAFLMIGRDSLLSTLSESLASIVRSHGRLSDLAFPTIPPETGVSVTERIVGEAVSVGGAELKKGDRLRLYFQGFAQCPADADKLLMFGAGVHSCLGRKISLDAWQALAGLLARVPKRIELVGYEVFPDPIFTMPRYVRVRLS